MPADHQYSQKELEDEVLGLAYCCEAYGRGGEYSGLPLTSTLPEDLLKNQFNVVEGVPTSISLQELCREQQVEMPISETVYSILHEGLDPNDALFQLLERKIPGPEIKRID